MTLLASPLESIESAVIWLLVVFSVATWGLALLKGVQFARLKAQDRKFHKQFWAASSLDSAAELSETHPGAAARVAQAGYAAIQVGDAPHAADLSQAITIRTALNVPCASRSCVNGAPWKPAWLWSRVSAAPRPLSACSAPCGGSWKR